MRRRLRFNKLLRDSTPDEAVFVLYTTPGSERAEMKAFRKEAKRIAAVKAKEAERIALVKEAEAKEEAAREKVVEETIARITAERAAARAAEKEAEAKAIIAAIITAAAKEIARPTIKTRFPLGPPVRGVTSIEYELLLEEYSRNDVLRWFFVPLEQNFPPAKRRGEQ